MSYVIPCSFEVIKPLGVITYFDSKRPRETEETPEEEYRYFTTLGQEIEKSQLETLIKEQGEGQAEYTKYPKNDLFNQYYDYKKEKGKVLTGSCHVFAYDEKRRLTSEEALPKGPARGYLRVSYLGKKEEYARVGIVDNDRMALTRFLIPKTTIIGELTERHNPHVTNITFFENGRTERVLRTEKQTEEL